MNLTKLILLAVLSLVTTLYAQDGNAVAEGSPVLVSKSDICICNGDPDTDPRLRSQDYDGECLFAYDQSAKIFYKFVSTAIEGDRWWDIEDFTAEAATLDEVLNEGNSSSVIPVFNTGVDVGSGATKTFFEPTRTTYSSTGITYVDNAGDGGLTLFRTTPSGGSLTSTMLLQAGNVRIYQALGINRSPRAGRALDCAGVADFNLNKITFVGQGTAGTDGTNLTHIQALIAASTFGSGDNDADGNEVTNAADATTATGLTTQQQVDAKIAALVRSGSGTPEGSVTATPGTLYLNTAGGANTTLYVKETGTGNTGWVAK